jgi:cytochrome oxidase Cu insertion factor (SCO1/SenC/PrrC family)
MSRSYLISLLVVGLSLCGLSCQKSEQATGDRAANNASAGAQAGASPQQQQPSAPQTHLKVGDRAPDFELTDTEGQKVRLDDYRGKKNVVLAFYVLAFTGG